LGRSGMNVQHFVSGLKKRSETWGFTPADGHMAQSSQVACGSPWTVLFRSSRIQREYKGGSVPTSPAAVLPTMRSSVGILFASLHVECKNSSPGDPAFFWVTIPGSDGYTQLVP